MQRNNECRGAPSYFSLTRRPPTSIRHQADSVDTRAPRQIDHASHQAELEILLSADKDGVVGAIAVKVLKPLLERGEVQHLLIQQDHVIGPYRHNDVVRLRGRG